MMCRSIAGSRGLQLAVGVSQASSSTAPGWLDVVNARSFTSQRNTRRTAGGAVQRITSLRCLASSSTSRADSSGSPADGDAASHSDSPFTPPKRSISGSYLDAIFDAPNAFDRDDDVLQPSRGRENSDDWVINSEKYKQHRDEDLELNQEWDTDAKYPNTSRPARGGRPGFAPQAREKRTTMTSREKSVYSAIFDDLFTYDTPYAGGASTDALLNSSLFGNFAGNKNEQKLHAFYRKSVIQRKQMREGIQPKMGRKVKFATGLMHELLDVDGVTEANVSERFDVAKVQLQACQSQNAVWNWADENVWPAKETVLEEGADTAVAAPRSASIGSVSTSTATTPAAKSDRPFGMRTPLYAPVLFMMFKELRDRFRAPHAALAVLRNARNLGPESMVMGCTSDLYAEAIRTSWYVLNDLQGACDLVREARDTGILSAGASPYFTQRFAQNMSTSSEADSYESLQDVSRMAKVVDGIKQDVRRNAFRAQQAMGMDAQSHLLDHQTAMAQEMMNIVAPVTPPHAASQSVGGGAQRAGRRSWSGDRDDRRNAAGVRQRPTNFRPRLLTRPTIAPRSAESVKSSRPWHERSSAFGAHTSSSERGAE